jgi:hypothetical protein
MKELTKHGKKCSENPPFPPPPAFHILVILFKDDDSAFSPLVRYAPEDDSTPGEQHH